MMDREEVVKSREYIFADEACKYVDKDPINSFEEGAEYGYKFAVEKACDGLEAILEDFLHGGDSDKVIALFQEKMEEEE